MLVTFFYSMKYIATKTTYLEMRSADSQTIATRPVGKNIEVNRLHQPTGQYYKFLYKSVGSDLNWVDRLLLSDSELEKIIHDPKIEIWVLKVDGKEAGYAELDRRTSGEIELAYFGLFPEFIGQGLGKYFLSWAIQQAWSYHPNRVWVHTCDLDHPAALPTYRKAGFIDYREEIIQQAVPE
ncbi:MAG: GNAT family N-acetyltransferase [Blastopirellula sp.]|nr:MAG: GNAT family N-acetyltransferase [Blastopirellula sp.]